MIEIRSADSRIARCLNGKAECLGCGSSSSIGESNIKRELMAVHCSIAAERLTDSQVIGMILVCSGSTRGGTFTVSSEAVGFLRARCHIVIIEGAVDADITIDDPLSSRRTVCIESVRRRIKRQAGRKRRSRSQLSGSCSLQYRQRKHPECQHLSKRWSECPKQSQHQSRSDRS